MSSQSNHDYPKLHNAMWPGLVGKGSPGAEPCIDLDTMLELTSKAEVDGIKFDGVDIFLFDPHINIDISEDDLREIADKIGERGLQVGSVVAPIWPPTGGGPAMGSEEDRQKFVEQVRKGCRIAQMLREFGVREEGVVRIDSASSVEDWAKNPRENSRRIAETFRTACDVASDYGERLAAEGEICWGGMHSWKKMIEVLELVDRPKVIGFQADMAHTLLYILGYNAPEDAILPAEWNWSDPARLDAALKTLTKALRPWTIDFHVAQNDATVKGSGTHDKTGHHCLPDDPNGKLQIARHAGYWMRDEKGKLTKTFRHICWDGCMFPNDTMMQQQTWNDILSAMIAVRDAHGWSENGTDSLGSEEANESLQVRSRARPASRKRIKRNQPATRKPAGRTGSRPGKSTSRKAAKPAAKKSSKPQSRSKKPVKSRNIPAKPTNRGKSNSKTRSKRR